MKQQTQINKTEWKEIALGDKDYFEIVSSGINKFTGEKEYLSTESIKGTEIEKIECKIKYNDKPSRANMQPVINSVWFAKMQATLKVYAFTKDNEKEINQYILSTGFAGIKVLNKNISPDYIRIYLTTDKFNLEKDKLSTGSTQRGINNSFIIKIKIPLPFLPDGTPDLKEQERIVKILEENEGQIKRADRAEELLDEYLNSTFWEMFGNPRSNPKKWNLVQTKDLFDMKLGKMLSARNYTGKYLRPYLRNINVQWGYLDLRDIKQMDFDEKEFPKYLLKKGDILVCEGGEVGRTAIYNGEIKDCCYQNALHRLRVKNNSIELVYFVYFMIFANKHGLIKRDTIQVTIAHFTEEKFKRFKVMLPPLPLQQKFSRIVEQVEKMKENVNKTKQNAEELFNSLMSKAFKGEL